MLPHCDAFDGPDTFEETKLIRETHKILGDDSIGISATCVRVPVWRSHSEAVWIETERPLTADDARQLLEAAPGIRVVDDPSAAGYPMPSDASGGDDVLVGRIREDRSRRNGLALWVVADNLRKGAALNGVQIAELLRAARPDPCPPAGARGLRLAARGHLCPVCIRPARAGTCDEHGSVEGPPAPDHSRPAALRPPPLAAVPAGRSGLPPLPG